MQGDSQTSVLYIRAQLPQVVFITCIDTACVRASWYVFDSEKAICLNVCSRIFTSCRGVKLHHRSSVSPSHPSSSKFIMYYPGFSSTQLEVLESIRQLLHMCSTKVIAVCIFNNDGTSTLNFPSTSGRKYHNLVDNAVFIHNGSGQECIPIRAHVAVATQHMPRGV